MQFLSSFIMIGGRILNKQTKTKNDVPQQPAILAVRKIIMNHDKMISVSLIIPSGDL